MNSDSKAGAQKRADRIDFFKEELKTLEQEAVLELSDSQKTAISGYHNRLLSQFSDKFDIDTSHKEKQLSFGMRVVSFLGALSYGNRYEPWIVSVEGI